MTTEMIEVLKAGTDAMRGLQEMQDAMLPVIGEITLILENANVDLAALALRDAIEHRNRAAQRIEELGHKGRSWRGK